MSYQAVSAVLAHSRTRGSDRLVLLVLASHASEETFECYPGRDLLCKEAAMSERNLIYCLKKLEETRELTISRGNGRGNLTTYKINLEPVEESQRVQQIAPFIAQERVQSPVKTVQGPAPFQLQKVQRIAPIEKEKGCNPASERVQDSVEKGAKSSSALIDIEPSGTIKEPKEDIYITQVREVFVYWQVQLNHPRSDLSGKRKSAVRARLVQGYTVEEIKQAVDGCRASPWHMGKNPDGTVYDDLTLICRDDSHLNMFISKAGNNGKSQASKTGNDTDRGSAQRTTEDYGIRDCKVL